MASYANRTRGACGRRVGVAPVGGSTEAVLGRLGQVAGVAILFPVQQEREVEVFEDVEAVQVRHLEGRLRIAVACQSAEAAVGAGSSSRAGTVPARGRLAFGNEVGAEAAAEARVEVGNRNNKARDEATVESELGR